MLLPHIMVALDLNASCFASYNLLRYPDPVRQRADCNSQPCHKEVCELWLQAILINLYGIRWRTWSAQGTT